MCSFRAQQCHALALVAGMLRCPCPAAGEGTEGRDTALLPLSRLPWLNRDTRALLSLSCPPAGRWRKFPWKSKFCHKPGLELREGFSPRLCACSPLARAAFPQPSTFTSLTKQQTMPQNRTSLAELTFHITATNLLENRCPSFRRITRSTAQQSAVLSWQCGMAPPELSRTSPHSDVDLIANVLQELRS